MAFNRKRSNAPVIHHIAQLFFNVRVPWIQGFKFGAKNPNVFKFGAKDPSISNI
jgi:hypothetical protein